MSVDAVQVRLIALEPAVAARLVGTVGGIVSAVGGEGLTVVKFQVKLPAIALPAASFAAVVMVAVY